MRFGSKSPLYALTVVLVCATKELSLGLIGLHPASVTATNPMGPGTGPALRPYSWIREN